MSTPATMPAVGGLVDFQSVRQSGGWADWRELTRAAPPFVDPEFFELSRPLAGEGEALVACAWRERLLVGALPLSLSGHTIQALRSDHTPSFDFSGSEDALEAIWKVLRSNPRWTDLVLKNVPRGSLLTKLLPALAERDGCAAVVRPGARHLVLPLQSFEAQMNAKFLTNLRRCERKAGHVELERIASPTRADVESAISIEQRGWKGAAGTSIAADPRVHHLYHVLARLLGRRGEGSLYFLRVGAQRVATAFCVERGGTLHVLKIGHDPAMAALSPGHLLVWKIAAEAERRGLTQLDFAGRDDAWKRKWTHEGREHVTVIVYARSLRGRALHVLRDEVQPRIRTRVEDLRAPLRRGCQRDDIVGTHTPLERIRGRLQMGLGIKSGLRRLLAPTPKRPPLGEPSRFEPGAWVRVLDQPRLRATLDARSRLRGLEFVPLQWETCGQVYRVDKAVRRIRDDHGVFRPVQRTVLLEGVTCAGTKPEPAGCGRHCPMMFRDEWLEPAEAPSRGPSAATLRPRARVRDLAEISAGLDVFGRRGGVMFMPEMAAHAGRRFEIARRFTRVFEYDRWTDASRPIYLLDGLHCTGAVVGDRGPCDRACALLWHEDWLIIDPTTTDEAPPTTDVAS